MLLGARMACADGIADKGCRAAGAVRGDPRRGSRRHRAAGARAARSSRPRPTGSTRRTWRCWRCWSTARRPAGVADTLPLDRRRVGRRIERLLGRLRAVAAGRGAPDARCLKFRSSCRWSPWSSSAPPVASANSTSTRACSTSGSSSSARAVDDQVANLVVAQLLHLESQDPDKDISLYINSPGGSIYAGAGDLRHDAVHQARRGDDVRRRRDVDGLAAADRRRARASAWRCPTRGSSSTSPRPASRASRRTSRSTPPRSSRPASAIDEIYAKHTGQPDEQVHHDMERDRFFKAEEAAEYGLIDRVIHKH